MTTETRVTHTSEAFDSDSPVHKGRLPVNSIFFTSEEGNPMGGSSSAEGIGVTWQNGVLEPNGAILEDLLSIAIDRLQFFQGDGGFGKFSCRENALAITHIQEAMHWLAHRTQARRRRGVEGTYNN